MAHRPETSSEPSVLPIYLEPVRGDDFRDRVLAVSVTIAIHAAAFFVVIPAHEILAEPEPKRGVVVQQPRFRLPPPAPIDELPKPRTRKVPIPDPTPSDPEPIRELLVVEPPELTASFEGLVIQIPSQPPSEEPAEESGPLRVGGDVKAPEKVYAPAPVYTELARRARIQGTVIVDAVIDEQGRVTNVRLLKTLPLGLGEAAEEAIYRWRFSPATIHGRPVAVAYTLTVQFSSIGGWR